MNMHTGEKATLVTLCGTVVVVALVAGCTTRTWTRQTRTRL